MSARKYPDGVFRPLARGWLHGGLVPLGALAVFLMALARDPRWELQLMILAKTVSLAASANLHVRFHATAESYAVANAIDFALLPFNGGGVLAVATPRSMAWLRAVHCAVLVAGSLLIIHPVYCWTHCACAGDKPGMALHNSRRTAVTLVVAAWILGAWPLQAGLSRCWAGYIVFVFLGYFSYQSNYLGVPPMPWHGRWWGAHDDFHALNLLADVCVFQYAIPVASSMAAPELGY